MDNDYRSSNLDIPDGFIVLISGVPGVGKTTISYELLKLFDEFRIIEETDLIREILRGYNEYIKSTFGNEIQGVLSKIQIYDRMKFLSFSEARLQCKYMKNSIINIIERQQRKGISTIINGVHIIPEVFTELGQNMNIIFINLFISDEDEFYKRFNNRNKDKYNPESIKQVFQTNLDLKLSTSKLICDASSLFNNIDVTTMSIIETLNEVLMCIEKRVKYMS